MDGFGFIAIALMGFTLGLLGAGGSILAVPILVYLFKLAPSNATFYSLFVVGFSAAVGVLPYARRKKVEFRQAIMFFLPSLAGVFISRRLLLPLIPPHIRDLVVITSFAVVMILAARSMLKKRKSHPLSHSIPQTMVVGLGVGSLTGFVGAGGGFLIVPALANRLGFAMDKAIGTSMLIIAINALFGFSSDWIMGAQVDWIFILKLVAAAVSGIFAGTKLNAHIPSEKLKLIFGWFVLVLGSFVFVNQVMKYLSSFTM